MILTFKRTLPTFWYPMCGFRKNKSCSCDSYRRKKTQKLLNPTLLISWNFRSLMLSCHVLVFFSSYSGKQRKDIHCKLLVKYLSQLGFLKVYELRHSPTSFGDIIYFYQLDYLVSDHDLSSYQNSIFCNLFTQPWWYLKHAIHESKTAWANWS